MSNQSYNGWTNWATWNVNLWLNNDYGLYTAMVELTQEADDVTILADDIQQWVDGWKPEVLVTGMWSDLITYVLQDVNWLEIAQALWEAERDDEEQEDE